MIVFDSIVSLPWSQSMAFDRVDEVEQMFLILHWIMVPPLNDSPRKGVHGGGITTWETSANAVTIARRVNILLKIKF